MGLSFFGLTSDLAPEFRASLFTQIHEIVFHGKGGYDWNTVYEMPRWLRLFTFKKIQDFYDKETESYESANLKSGNKNTLIDSSGKINRESWGEVPKSITPGPKFNNSNTKSKIKYK